MKKIVSILAMFALAAGVAFAEAPASVNTTARSDATEVSSDTKTRTIEVEDTYTDLHPTATTVKLELEFTPLTGEVYFYYTCMAASYDQGEAMNTAIAVLQDFQADNQFTHYKYQSKDKTKYFKDGRDVKMVTYRSSVIFTR